MSSADHAYLQTSHFDSFHQQRIASCLWAILLVPDSLADNPVGKPGCRLDTVNSLTGGMHHTRQQNKGISGQGQVGDAIECTAVHGCNAHRIVNP